MTSSSLYRRLAKKPRIKVLSQAYTKQAQRQFETTQQKQRLFTDFIYKAGTWQRKRRVILKAEHLTQGSNPRYVVTNLAGGPQTLYDQVYCVRDEMVNRIKEQHWICLPTPFPD